MDSALDSTALGVTECQLFYGARTPDLLVYRELADRCAAALPDFRASYFVEGVDGAEGRLDGLRIGRLDIPTITAELAPATDWAHYLSGPKLMITTFRQQLLSQFSVPESQVIIDAWD